MVIQLERPYATACTGMGSALCSTSGAVTRSSMVPSAPEPAALLSVISAKRQQGCDTHFQHRISDANCPRRKRRACDCCLIGSAKFSEPRDLR